MTNATSITKAQAQVLADALQEYAQAQYDFETWYLGSYYCNGYHPFGGTFEEKVEKDYRWFAKRDAKKNQDAYIAERVKRVRDAYEEMHGGIVTVHTSSNTLRALEKKGLIEVIRDGRRSWDKIRLLYV